MNKTLYQVGFFAIVGLSATAIHALIFSVLGWTKFNPLFANFIAFCCAVPVSFIGNRYLTFKEDGSFPRFCLMSACGFALNHINVWIITEHMSLGWVYALPGMLLFVPAFSFIISKFWVYER